MRSELVRAVVAAPVVVLLPHALTDNFRRRFTRMAIALILMAAALAPYLQSWRVWLVIAAVVALTAPRRPLRVGSWASLALAALATLIATLVLGETAARHAVVHVSDMPSLVVVLAGFFASTIVAGAIVGEVLHPFAVRLKRTDAAGIERAGRMIGWLERTLLYGLILAGAPDAAALVVAAKSVARFPSFKEESFAEYYLIGTLLSFLSALAIGIGVRAVLGLRPLLPAGS